MDSAEAHAHEAHTHAPALNLNRLAISATTHCLTGCAIGEVMGMIIATALGWSDVGQIALAVGLAYVFGFGLTALPLIRAGLPAGVVISTALAADTISITILDHMRSIDPTIEVRPEARFVDDGDVITASGLSAGIDMALDVVSRLDSAERGRDVREGTNYAPSAPHA